MKVNKVLISAAFSGLFIVGCKPKEEDKKVEQAKITDAKGECHGINACKGQGACGGVGYSCAGKNACKGKGWLKLSKEECDKKGGKFKGS